MVVGYGVMPPLRLTAAAETSEEADEEGGTGGDRPPPFMDLPRLLATARHGDLSTLPPDQRHLLARMLLAGGVMPEVLIRRRLALLHRRQQQLRQQQQERQQEASRLGTNDGFKHPSLPVRHRPTKECSHETRERSSPREVKPPNPKRSRERTPVNSVQRSSPPVQPNGSLERKPKAAHSRNASSSSPKQLPRHSENPASSPTSPPARSHLNARERTPPDRSGGRGSPPPLKRFRSNKFSGWVPVTPRTHVESLQGLSPSSCSSSDSSSASSCPPSQWKPVKVPHLASSLKNTPLYSSASASKSLSSKTHVRKLSVGDLSLSHSKIKIERSWSLPNSPENLDSKSNASGNEKKPVPSLLRIYNNSDSNDSSNDSTSSSSHSNIENKCHSPECVPKNNVVCSSPTSICQGAATLKYHWMNQLSRIFLQEVSEDAQDKEADTAESSGGSSSASSSTTANTTSLPSGGSTVCSSSTESSSNNSGNKSSASQSTPVVTTLPGSGMGNPFARAAPQATWGSESHDQRPIIAPSRLGPPSDTGTTKVSSSGGSSVLRQPVLGGGGGGGGRPSSSGKPSSSIFSPPTLTVTGSSPPQTSKSAFKLKPSVLGSANPFTKPSSTNDKADSATGPDDEIPGTSDEASTLTSGQDISSSTSVTSNTSPTSGEREPSRTAERTGSSSSNINRLNSGNGRSMFVPLSRNGDGKDSSLSPSLRNNSFIFGQNLQSRVTGADSVTSSSDAAATTNGERPTGNLFSEAASEISRGRSPDSAAATNGRLGTGNLFSDAASEILPPSEDNVWTSGQSLAESSRELAEKENSQKRKFDQVEVITGEESESNVLQMNCKLYAWVSGSWQERGRGILRLNDWDAGKEIHSRLVIRTQGTLVVMLNTKVWAEMSVERASNKSVRFTALDADGQPKIFLAMGSPKDVDLLYNSLEWRVAASRSQTHEDGEGSDNTKKAKKDDAGAIALTR